MGPPLLRDKSATVNIAVISLIRTIGALVAGRGCTGADERPASRANGAADKRAATPASGKTADCRTRCATNKGTANRTVTGRVAATEAEPEGEHNNRRYKI
jgi:hypothetical protein